MVDRLSRYFENAIKLVQGKFVVGEGTEDVYNFSRAGALITGVVTVATVATAVFSVTVGGLVAASFFSLVFWDLTMMQLNLSKMAKSPLKEGEFSGVLNNLKSKVEGIGSTLWLGFDTNFIANTTITRLVFVIYKNAVS